jgi:eukaryotic-like serine/threonine-protein kinase
MSSSAQALLTPLPLGTAVAPGTLRAEMDARRGSRRRFDIREAIGVVVPLCTRLAELHATGRTLFIHPSSIAYEPGQPPDVVEDLAHTPPSLPRDRSCLAPEERKGSEGDARASVFAIGAMLYEMLTGHSVGPGMRRPGEVVRDLPPALEVLLGKALVADPKHRPGDLGALAQALHHIAPGSSVAPPAADESHLDHEGGFDVDVSLSMIPPAPRAPTGVGVQPIPAYSQPRLALKEVLGDGPFTVGVPEGPPSSRRADDPTLRLAELKASLEADPRPRYVVIKDGMDHGPFSAVELLQQLATHSFHAEHALRDSISNEERQLKDWEEFAPFAHHAKLNREIVQEKRALEAVVSAEKKGTQYKALIGGTIIAVAAAAALGLWMRDKKNRERELAVQSDQALSVDVDGGLGAGKTPGGGGGVPGPGGVNVGAGNHPVLGGGMSCEGAQARYVEDYSKMGAGVPPDLSAGAYGAVLNRGGYLNSCGVPSNMEVNICAAVQNGRAVGVTVSTRPSNPGISSCVAGAVRGLGFPSHPRLDVTRTTFAAN